MRVFKACLKIIWAHRSMLIVFYIAFSGLAVGISSLYIDSFSMDFSAIRPTFAIINRDGDSTELDGLREYLLTRCDEVDDPIADTPEAISDAAFYEYAEYILIIPKGFSADMAAGRIPEIGKITGKRSAGGYYADMLTNQYLNAVRAYGSTGMTGEEAAQAAMRELSNAAQISVKHESELSPVSEKYQGFMKMACYTMMLLVPLVICSFTTAFRKFDISQRSHCAPIRPRRVTLEMTLCGGVMGILAWAMVNAVGLIAFADTLKGTDRRQILLLLLNSFIFMTVTIGIAMMITVFAGNWNLANPFANMISLVFAFLGGLFVPIEMFGDALVKLAHFIPTFWNVDGINRISQLTSFTSESLGTLLQPMLLQLAFAATFICVSLAVGRSMGQKAPSAQTELEM